MSSPDVGRVAPAFSALLADPRTALRRPPPDLALADLRAAANRSMARARGPEVAAVAELIAPAPGGPIPIRIYRPNDAPAPPLILFIHGGGFVLGDLDSHDAICRSLAVSTGAAVAAVAYRLAPEAPFPAPLNDCVAALAWLRQEGRALGLDPDRIGLAGDSAGGQLAVATALMTDVAVQHVGLFYPLIDPARASASARLYAEGYMLTGSFLDFAWASYRGPGRADGDPLFDLSRADLASLPGVTLVTAEFDPLRDEGEAFAARLEQAGVPVAMRRYPGMIHGFVGLPQLTPAARDAIGFIDDRMRAALFA